MKSYRFDLLLLGLFVGIIGVFFYPTLLYGKLPVPSDTLVGLYHPWRDFYSSSYPRGIPYKNFLITDPIRQQIPWRKVAIENWKKGLVPRWNPYAFSGTPLAANIQAAVFYPLNILFFLFSFPLAWTMLIVLQPLLAGLFLYLYLRYQGVSPVSCLFAAIAWSLSGFSIAWLTWGTIMQTILWVPLILLALDHIIIGKHSLGKTFGWIGLGIIAGIMLLLAGHAQVAFYGLTLCAVYTLWRLLGHAKKFRITQPLVACLVLLALIVAIASIQLVPFIRFVLQTSRGADSTAWLKAGWFIPYQHLVQFIAPDFFGNPATLNYWGEWNYGEFIGYIGLVPLFFSLFAFFLARKEVVIRFFGIVGALELLFCLPTIVSTIPYHLHIPLVQSLQPTRLLSLVDLSMCILAGFGLDYFLKHADKKIFWIIGLVGTVFFGVWVFVLVQQRSPDPVIQQQYLVSQRNLVMPFLLYVSGSLAIVGYVLIRRPKAMGSFLVVGIVGLTVFDLVRFGWKFTPFTPKEYFFPETAVIRFLQEAPKPFRIMSLDDKILPPNVTAYYGIESIEGYDPLYLSRYEQYIGSSEKGSVELTGPYGFNRIITAHNSHSPLLDYLNVSYVLSLEELHDPTLIQVFAEGETRIYKNTQSLPRAYLATNSTSVAHEPDILAAMLKSETNNHVFVLGSVAGSTSPLQTSEFVTITAYEDERMRLTTNSTVDRLLVINNMYSPEWKVTIDGQVSHIQRVNYLFMGVVVPAGSHIVTVSFQ